MLIVSIIAMVRGETALVKANLLGTMLAHLTLGLGLCFFWGGVYHKEQSFNMTVHTLRDNPLSSLNYVLTQVVCTNFDIIIGHVSFFSAYSGGVSYCGGSR